MKTNKDLQDIKINSVGYLLCRALSGLIKNLNKELKKEGLDLQQSHFSILKVLSKVDYISQTDLCKTTGKDRGALSRCLDFLESNNYVKRTAINRCKNGISLTEKGRELLPLLDDIARRVREKAFSDFDNESEKKFLEALDKIYMNSL